MAAQLVRRFSACSLRTGLGGEHEQNEVPVSGERHALVAELDVPDEWMMESLEAGVVSPDVVPGLADAKVLALRRQFADQVRQVPVVRVAARFGAKHGHGSVRGLFPIDEERCRAWLEEAEASGVRRSARPGTSSPARAVRATDA